MICLCFIYVWLLHTYHSIYVVAHVICSQLVFYVSYKYFVR